MLDFLPISKKDMQNRGWSELDFIIISGDAYIDHPSFGTAIIARILEKFNYKVGIIAQPDINQKEDFFKLGTPKHAFLITAGNIDSMVNHYTVALKKRTKDYYSPEGKMGLRPDRATIKYCHKLKEYFPTIPLIIGGIEASLRRLAHYDYWDNQVRRSILLDSKADLLIYGMAEKTIIEVADALSSNMDIKDIIYIRNTVWKTKSQDFIPHNTIMLSDYDQLLQDKMAYVNSFNAQYQNTDPFYAKALCEPYKNIFVIQNPPEFPLSREELDQVYNIEYIRKIHPIYSSVPAIEEVQFSIISNRGCYGGCNFCALTLHQGKIIQSRSLDSIQKESIEITKLTNFKGYIHDIGGPTANFYEPACQKQEKNGTCQNKQCIGYKPCENLNISHKNYLTILKTIRSNPNIKKVFVRSGIRYDYLMYDKDPEFFEELVKHHISGQLKIAPEHVCDQVLKAMGKPSFKLYQKFVEKYHNLNQKYQKKQFLVPYLMSSHPGSTLESAIKLAEYLHENNLFPEQVQDFYPTPATASTCMYYTGINPFTQKEIYIPKTKEEKAMQRALIQYRYPQNYDLVKKALIKANRTDLIGYDKHCLIKPIKENIKNNFHYRHK